VGAALLMRINIVVLETSIETEIVIVLNGVGVGTSVGVAGGVGVFVTEKADGTVAGAAVESVGAAIELRESSLSVKKTISAAAFEALDIVHNAFVNSVIKGSSINGVSLKANIINFLVEIILEITEVALTNIKVIRLANLRLSSANIVSSNSKITIIILCRDHNFGSSKKTIGGTCATSGTIYGNISLSSSEADLISVAEIGLSQTSVESTLVAVNTRNTAESLKSGTVTAGTETRSTTMLVSNTRLNLAASAEKSVSATSESVISKLTGLTVGRTTVEIDISASTTRAAMTDVTLSVVGVMRGRAGGMAEMATAGASTTEAEGLANLAVAALVKGKIWLSDTSTSESTTKAISEVSLRSLATVGLTLAVATVEI